MVGQYQYMKVINMGVSINGAMPKIMVYQGKSTSNLQEHRNLSTSFTRIKIEKKRLIRRIWGALTQDACGQGSSMESLAKLILGSFWATGLPELEFSLWFKQCHKPAMTGNGL